jgi:hypothetical protein
MSFQIILKQQRGLIENIPKQYLTKQFKSDAQYIVC